MANILYFGDNLHVLRQHIADGSVDLVYLDPPFNSNASYNVLFATPEGRKSHAQTAAFEDTWHWGDEAEAAYDAVLRSGTALAPIVRGFRSILSGSDMMAYLTMMAVRLIELHRVLKSTGSLYLHCDATASHYLKLLLDGIFGPDNFRSEITWKRTTSHGNVSRNYGAVADHILFYSKSDSYTWNQVYSPFEPAYIEEKFRWKDRDGRRWQSVTLRNPSPRPNLVYEYLASNGVIYRPHPNGWSCDIVRMRKYDGENRLHFPDKPDGKLRLKMYLDESPGIKAQNIWSDIPAVNSRAIERIGYPTQKPLALLNRIVTASTNRGDVILDPFCGCGTAIHAAENLGRQWLGIDITHVAIQIIQDRLRRYFSLASFEIIGRPKDLAGARALAEHDKYQFQWWATWLVGGHPRGGEKKGADRGVDGEFYFKTGANEDGFGIISVKGGRHLSPSMVSELCAVREREGADLGLFICLEEPTREMRANAAAAGVLHGKYPKVQILTVEQLLAGYRPQVPPLYDTITVAQAARQRTKAAALPTPDDIRRAPFLKLPITGGRSGQSRRAPPPGELLSALEGHPSQPRFLEAAEEPGRYEAEPTPPRLRRKRVKS